MNESVVFNAAVKLPQEERAAFLNAICAGNPQLRTDVDALLQEHDGAGSFLSRPAAAPPATDLFRPITEGPGTIIGPYKLLQQIGEGGFGVVYMAEQQRPVRRKVALKIIKPGMDTREVIARFESERQALALMDHPNIARVLDAGATESGRPYFVMELVKGVPITEYCDKNALPTDKRLALFIAVCHAVQHAHQKGVIHRDLKPSNVMVTLHDGQPVPKVIDFGVSKATSQQLTEKTLFTAYGQMIGTPAYMSPEQAEMSGLDIDTRSDTYSLGVLLYELFTGTTPFDSKRLREAGYVEMQRIIREEAPPRPSTRVSTMGEALTILSSQRSTDPKKLGQQLRGDLDVIVMKALEKERNRRYDTPNAFADDIQRFLSHEAIVARPASTTYRVKKFVQRNLAAVAAGSAIAAALLVGTSVSTWLAVRESQASRLAEAERLKAEKSLIEAVTAKGEAERERDRVEKAKAEESKQRQLALEQKQAAEAAQQLAIDQRTIAEQQRDKAAAAGAELAREKERQRRLLYAAQLNLTQTAWNEDNAPRVQDLLNATRPRLGESDLRGIEWHYWQRLLHQEERSFRLPVRLPGASRDFSDPERFELRSQDTATSAFLSHDASRLAAVLPIRTTVYVDSRVTIQTEYVLQVWDTADGSRPIFNYKLPQPAGPFRTRASSPRIAHLDSSRVVLSQVMSTRYSPDELRERAERMRNENLDAIRDKFSRRARTPSEVEIQSFTLDSTPASAKRAPHTFNTNSTFVISRDGSRIAALTTGTSNDDAPAATNIVILDGQTGDTLDQVPSPFDSVNLTTASTPQITLGAVSDDGRRVVLVESSPPRLPAGLESLPRTQQPRKAIVFHLDTQESVSLEPKASPTASPLTSLGVLRASSFAFSPSGQQLVSASRSVLLFDAATGQEFANLSGAFSSNSPSVTSSLVAISANGRWLVSGASELDKCLLALWDFATGEQIAQLKGHTYPPVLAAFSPDSSHVYSADASGTVKVWSVADFLPSMSLPAEPPSSLDNRLSRSTIPSPSGEWLATLPTSPRSRPPFGPQGSGEISIAPPFELQLKSGRGLVHVGTLAGPADEAVFSPDSKLLATVAIDQNAKLEESVEVRVWNVATGEPLPLAIPRFRALTITRSGFWGSGRGSFGPPSGEGSPDANPPRDQAVSYRAFSGGAPVFSRDGQRLAFGCLAPATGIQTSYVQLWDLEQRREIPLDLPPPPAGSVRGGFVLQFSIDSQLLLVKTVSYPERTPRQAFQVIDAATGEFLWEGNSASVDCVSVSADSRRLAGIWLPTASASPQPAVVTWEATSGRELSRIELPNRPYTSLAISPSGDRVAVQSAVGVSVYDVDARQLLFTLDAVVDRLQFTADGQRLLQFAVPSELLVSNSPLASGGFLSPVERFSQRDVKVWDAVTGQELLTVPPESPLHPQFVNGRAAKGLAPLNPEVDAQSLVDWLLAPNAEVEYLSRPEIKDRLEKDPSLASAVREIAWQLAASRQRSGNALATAALNVLQNPNLARDQYQRALDWLTEAIEQTPDDAVLISRQGAAFYRLGDYPAAQAALERSIQLRAAAKQPSHPETYAFLAMTHHQLGKADEARRVFVQTQREWESASRLNSENRGGRGGFGGPGAFRPPTSTSSPEAFETLKEAAALLGLPLTADLIAEGNALRGKQQFDQAIEKYNQAIALDDENSRALVARAQTWRYKSDFDKAIADCDAAIRLDSKAVEAYGIRGLVWMAKQDAKRALQDFNTAVDLSPANDGYLSNRGDAQRQLGNVLAALADYSQAIKITSSSRSPAVAYHYRLRGDLWQAEGEYALAVRDYSESIRLSPDIPVLYNKRGASRLRLGDYEGALQDCEAALLREPGAAVHLGNLGSVQIFVGKYAEALANVDRAIQAAPKFAAPHFSRGYLFEKQGHPDRAAAEFAEFLRLFEKHADGLLDRAIRWVYFKEYDKAIADYTALLALEPAHAVALRDRGRTWARKGEFENATRDMEAAIKAAPDNPEEYRVLAWFRAVCPDEQFRDPSAALAAAAKANELGGGKHWKYLDTLAAAHAAAGNFTEAIKHEEAALALLAGFDKPNYQSRLALYRQGKAFRVSVAAKPASD